MEKMDWKDIVKECQKKFEKEHESMFVRLTTGENIYTKYGLLKEGKVLNLKGRTDGLIYLKDLPYVPIGLFRVNIRFPVPTINDLEKVRDDRTQILLYMYNLTTAHIWRCQSENIEVFEKMVVNRNDIRINEIFESMCKMTSDDTPKLQWGVSEYLETKYSPFSQQIASKE